MTPLDQKAFEEEVRQSLERSRIAFQGTYADAIAQLAGLSRAEIDGIRPGTSDIEEYDRLIGVVKAASRVNASQAALRRQIEKLGEVAVNISKKVPGLASVFV